MSILCMLVLTFYFSIIIISIYFRTPPFFTFPPSYILRLFSCGIYLFCQCNFNFSMQEQASPRASSQEITLNPRLVDAPLLSPFNFNDLFVWAVLQQRQQIALFLWQHGEEALARATVACKLYRSMAFEARQSSMDDNIAERFKEYSL